MDNGLVQNIITCGDEQFVLVQFFGKCGDYFTYPVSSRALSIYRVSHLRPEQELVGANDVRCKCALFPEEAKPTFVALPLLHSLSNTNPND